MLTDTLKTRSEIAAVAAETYALGLQSQRSGNLSVIVAPGKRFLITRTGSRMGCLDVDHDLMLAEVGGALPPGASSEALVHQRIYQLTNHLAILHTHPPYAIAAGFGRDEIPMVYNEAKAALKIGIRVINSSVTDGHEGGEEPNPIAQGLESCGAILVRGHGLFVAAKEIDTCLYLTTLAEINAKIYSSMRNLQ